jgi:transcriptional regulator with XRE-family HTH domain
MAKSFKLLKDKMSLESRGRADLRTRGMLTELALQDLRKSLNLTQEQIAQALNMKQAAVSRLESQDDMYISTLSRFVAALGGHLKLVAAFPDKEVIIEQFSDYSEAEETTLIR